MIVLRLLPLVIDQNLDREANSGTSKIELSNSRDLPSDSSISIYLLASRAELMPRRVLEMVISIYIWSNFISVSKSFAIIYKNGHYFVFCLNGMHR